jgi:hypothetical protein
MEYNLNKERYFDVAEFFYDHVRDVLKYDEGAWTFKGEPCNEAKIHMLMVKDLAKDLLEIASQFSNRSASVMYNDRDKMIHVSTNLMLIVNSLQDKDYRDKLIKELIIIYQVVE